MMESERSLPVVRLGYDTFGLLGGSRRVKNSPDHDAVFLAGHTAAKGLRIYYRAVCIGLGIRVGRRVERVKVVRQTILVQWLVCAYIGEQRRIVCVFMLGG